MDTDTGGGVAEAIALMDDEESIETLLAGLPAHIAEEMREELPRRKGATTRCVWEETKTAYFFAFDAAALLSYTFYDVTPDQAANICARITSYINESEEGTVTTDKLLDAVIDIYQRVTGARIER